MTAPQMAPYGSWKSPITSDLIVSGTISLSQICVDGEDIYWIEQRPSEGGRNVIVRLGPDGSTEDVNPAPYNARTRVHEYGGGAYLVSDGVTYFSNYADQRLYRQERGGEPEPITPEQEFRYADCRMDSHGRLICVREDHTGGGHEPSNTIVALDASGDDSGGTVLVSGSDFYSNPRVSPDGSKLAWLSWNHPNMPWDGTELWVAALKGDGSLGEAERIAGGPDVSICHPEWSPEGALCFVSDRTCWWNLYQFRNGIIDDLCVMEAEFGRPQWQFGGTTYGFLSEDRFACAYVQNGTWRLATLDTASRELSDIETPFTEVGRFLNVVGGKILTDAGSATLPTSIVRIDPESGEVEVLRSSSTLDVDAGYLSVPEAIEFPTENGLTAHGFYYPPKNRDFTAPEGEKPPLLVLSHGGPTSATSTTLNLNIQYWTSRGFAVLDVNYGGSTGYGTVYRRRLNHQWGVLDVDDCANGARYLVERGLVDGERLAIRGGSAGGYTTLNALTFRDLFKAGASYYGISDLEAMAADTHKFESRYLDTMVGPYPERKDVYHERSSIHFVDRLNTPVIFFQGLEDKVVPPNQAEMMVEALREKGVPVAYVPFEGEQHGFRQAATIKRSLDGEFYFYSRVFGFEPADEIEPVPIENM